MPSVSLTKSVSHTVLKYEALNNVMGADGGSLCTKGPWLSRRGGYRDRRTETKATRGQEGRRAHVTGGLCSDRTQDDVCQFHR